MKKVLKIVLSSFLRANELFQRRILRLLGGAGFANPYFGVGRLWTHLIVQKVFRINSHVPWPVHWTAVVKSPEKIERGAGCPGIGHGAYLDGRNGIIFGGSDLISRWFLPKEQPPILLSAKWFVLALRLMVYWVACSAAYLVSARFLLKDDFLFVQDGLAKLFLKRRAARKLTVD